MSLSLSTQCSLSIGWAADYQNLLYSLWAWRFDYPPCLHYTNHAASSAPQGSCTRRYPPDCYQGCIDGWSCSAEQTAGSFGTGDLAILRRLAWISIESESSHRFVVSGRLALSLAWLGLFGWRSGGTGLLGRILLRLVGCCGIGRPCSFLFCLFGLSFGRLSLFIMTMKISVQNSILVNPQAIFLSLSARTKDSNSYYGRTLFLKD